ncbi:MAG: ATPase P [Anaerolineaceae bacterium]|nr:ATPase P [Anaerolineaceae bacterium]
MIELLIPGRDALTIEHVVLDVNGTIALDGVLLPGVQERLTRLQEHCRVHLLTADTHGKQAEIDTILGIKATIISHGAAEKAAHVVALGGKNVATIGNGANDSAMFQAAVLRIAVLGGEGLSAALLTTCDVLVRDVNDGLDLLLLPARLKATLRR